MSEHRKPMANITPFGLRMQPDLKARVEQAARENNRSMNAEIVAALEVMYPPKSIDVRTLSEFLENLAGVSAPDGDKKLLKAVNEALAKADQPWTVKAGWDGAVTFYPYATRKDQKNE